MVSGKLLLFVSLLFGVCSLFLLFEFCISRVHEHANECSCSWLLSVFSSMIRFSPVSSLSDIFFSVSVALAIVEALLLDSSCEL